MHFKDLQFARVVEVTEGKDPGAGDILIYFRCDDCATETARAIENGGRLHAETMSIGQYGFTSLI